MDAGGQRRLSRPQVEPAQTIGASYGDALLAAIGTGLVDPSTDWSRMSERWSPIDHGRAVYDDLFETYVQLYPDTKGHVHRLAELQESGVSPPRPSV